VYFSDGATPGPRDISCLRLCLCPLFWPSNLGYIGWGVLLNRENHPPFSRLDPAGTSSTVRSPTDGSRPRTHETCRVGDYVRSPFFDPQTLDILGEGYCWAGRTTLPLPVLTLLLHPQPQDPPQTGRDPGPTRHIVSAIMFVPPFSTPNPGIYMAWDTVEQGESPSLYPSWPH